MEQPTVEELCSGFKRTFSPVIADILDFDFGLHNQWLGPEIKPLAPEMRVAGPAFTMRWVNEPSPSTEEYARMLARMMDGLGPHMVPTLDTSKCTNAGYWGELMCTFCRERGIDGTVIDGGVRDPAIIVKLGFNLFASFACPLEANIRSRIESFQVPIFINGVLIRPGDFIVGDFGGLIVVPQEIVVDVFHKVEEVHQKESETRRKIRAGVSVDELTEGGQTGL
jgi:4-hydroxy-4-methyl-2-oxoglutarate aldolase